jgi:hypothetical protein
MAIPDDFGKSVILLGYGPHVSFCGFMACRSGFPVDSRGVIPYFYGRDFIAPQASGDSEVQR